MLLNFGPVQKFVGVLTCASSGNAVIVDDDFVLFKAVIVFTKKLILLLCFVCLLPLLPIRAEGDLPLAVRGAYGGSVTIVTLTDKARDNVKISVSIWYPSKAPGTLTTAPTSGPAMLKESVPLKPNPTMRGTSVADLDAGTLINVIGSEGRWTHVETEDSKSGWILSDNVMNRPSAPDSSGAPYPLILYSHGLGGSRWDDPNTFFHLASYGFVIASIDHTCDSQPTCLIDRPLDDLFVLDQLAGLQTGPLAGLIAKDNAGLIGASYGGYTVLATTGAQIDADGFKTWYTQRPKGDPNSIDVIDGFGHWHILDQMPNIAAYMNKTHVITEGQLWPPLNDPRIHAVLAIVPAATTLFGQRGQAAATVPTLVMAGTDDAIVSYNNEIIPLYKNFGAKDHFLLSLVGYTHSTYTNQNWGGYYHQFATAFFGKYMLGKQDYGQYLSAHYVGNFSDLVWGIYQKP
jgi:predicted dienelactone hydrolase